MNYIDIETVIEEQSVGISVIIPFYNGIEFLEEAVTSVVNQTYDKWELIIGINGYKDYIEIHDKVANIKNKFSKRIQNKIHINIYDTLGAPATLNSLAGDAIYDYVAFLDADDVWDIKKLSQQVPFIDKYDVIGTHCRYIGNMNFTPSIPLGDITEHDIFKINPLLHSSILIKKELVNFENHFVYDYNLWFKLYNAGKKFYNVPEILMYHRVHNNSAFNNNNQNYLEELKTKWRTIYDSSNI